MLTKQPRAHRRRSPCEVRLNQLVGAPPARRLDGHRAEVEALRAAIAAVVLGQVVWGGAHVQHACGDRKLQAIPEELRRDPWQSVGVQRSFTSATL